MTDIDKTYMTRKEAIEEIRHRRILLKYATMPRMYPYLIQAIDPVTNDERWYISQTECAKDLGCTKQLIHQVISSLSRYRHQKTARGYKIKMINVNRFRI